MTWEHSDNYLIHYGVKGQKHGTRRYQNEDGSLTAEGREHYGVGDPRQAGRSGEEKTASTKKNRGVEKQKKVRKAYKALGKALKIGAAASLIGLGTAAAYKGYKKSTDLRDKMREKASDEADEARWARSSAANYARTMIDNSKMARYDQKRGVNPESVNRRVSAFNQKYAHEYFQLAKKSLDLEKKYDHIAKTATRRKAVANYIKNHGRIVI